MTAPRVVNIRREKADVYVGRGSKWGNPFPITHGEDARTRADAIESYEAWLMEQPELITALSELKDKTLGCYCAPLRCHGDVLLRLANAGPTEANR